MATDVLRLKLSALRLPFLGMALAAVVGIGTAAVLPQVTWMIFTAGALLAACTVFLWHRSIFIYVLTAFVFATIHIWQTCDSPQTRLFGMIGDGRKVAELTGNVCSAPRQYAGKFCSFDIKASQITLGGQTFDPHAKISVEMTGDAPSIGDELWLRGSIENIPPSRNPGQFDARSWHGEHGVRSELNVSGPLDQKVLRKGGISLAALAIQCREWMKTTLSLGIADDAIVRDVVLGMTLGITSDMPDSLQQKFRSTGTFHLFAVSGLHVGMVGALLWIGLQPLRLSRRNASFIIIPALFFYALITGWKAATVRASIMAAVFLLGMILSRRPIALNSLCAAAFVILLTDTNELFNPGFQFSFTVVASILILAGPIRRWIESRARPDPLLPQELWSLSQRARVWLGHRVGGAAAISASSWIGSLPLMFVYFHLFSFSSLVANLVAVPLAFLIMAVSMLSLTVGTVSQWASFTFNNTNWLVVKALVGFLGTVAAMPGAARYVPFPDPSRPVATLTVYDTGIYGGACGIVSRDSAWLLDCGSAHSMTSTILPGLRMAGIGRLNGLIVSCGSGGRIGGWQTLLDNFPPGEVYEPALAGRFPQRKRLDDALGEKRIPIMECKAGDRITLGRDVHVSVLYPPSGSDAASGDDRVLVVRLEAAATRILFVSDAGFSAQQWLLQHADRKSLAADILVTGHNSGPATGTDFIRAVNPEVLIVPEEREGEHAQWLDAATATGIRVMDQSVAGAAVVKIYTDRRGIDGFLDGKHYGSAH